MQAREKYQEWKKSFTYEVWLRRNSASLTGGQEKDDGPVIAFFGALYDQTLRHLLGRILCHFFGHGDHMIIDEWGGPEGGGMGGGCDRCGFSFDHVMY
jgi:hypothetical protein